MPHESDTETPQAQVNLLIDQMAEAFAANHDENQHLIEPGSRSRRHAPKAKFPALPLQPGMQVKFLGDRRWWTVRTHNSKASVLTRTGDFGIGNRYTVISWAEGRRGPHASWEHEANTDEGCARIAAAMASGSLELSERRAICLDMEKVR